jgi:hypothetical protein
VHSSSEQTVKGASELALTVCAIKAPEANTKALMIVRSFARRRVFFLCMQKENIASKRFARVLHSQDHELFLLEVANSVN